MLNNTCDHCKQYYSAACPKCNADMFGALRVCVVKDNDNLRDNERKIDYSLLNFARPDCQLTTQTY